VIKCGVERLIMRPDMAHVLRQTLNFNEQDGFLDDRRASLIAEFDSRPKLYSRLEAEAYTQLAGMLVAAEQSPCRNPSTPVLPRKIELHLTLERQEDLQWLLTVLSVDKRAFVKDAVSESLLQMLPRAQDALQALPVDQRPIDPTEAVALLIAIGLLSISKSTDEVADSALPWEGLTTILMSRNLDVGWTTRLVAESAGLAVLSKPDSSGGGWPKQQFYEAKRRSLVGFLDCCWRSRAKMHGAVCLSFMSSGRDP
jgi:hypothetical protein